MGGGATSDNTIDNHVSAYLQGASAAAKSAITAAGAVNVGASEIGSITANVGSVDVAFAPIGGSIGVSLSTNKDDSTITADIDNAGVSAGSLTISASSNDKAKTVIDVTSVAVSLGGAGAGGNASAMVAPIVSAYAGSGADLKAAGDLSITASSTGSADAESYGQAFSSIAGVGDNLANATVGQSGSLGTSASIAAGALVSAGGNLTLSATATQTATTTATAIAGAVGVAVALATATTNVKQSAAATVGEDAQLSAGQNIKIISSNTTTKAAAAATNDYGGLIGGAQPGSTTTIDNSSNASLGTGVTAGATQGDFTLEATSSDTGALAQTTAQGGGIVAIAPNTIATSNLTDPATALVGADSIVTAPLGTILVQSQTATDVNSSATSNNGGVAAVSNSTANTTVTSNAASDVDQGAQLTADDVTIEAQGGSERSAQANSSATSSAIGTGTSSTTNLTTTYNAKLSLAAGTIISGFNQVQLLANTGAVVSTATADGVANALGSNTDVNVTSTLDEQASITTAPDSLIVAGSLSTIASALDPTLRRGSQEHPGDHRHRFDQLDF